LNPARDWVRNAKKNPDVDLEIGALRLRGRFSLVSDGSRAANVQQCIARKYWLAWIGSWFGLKSKEAFEITDLR